MSSREDCAPYRTWRGAVSTRGHYSGSGRDGRGQASSRGDCGSGSSGIGPVFTKGYSGSGWDGRAQANSSDDFGSVRSGIGPFSTNDYSGSGRGARGPVSIKDGSGRDGRAQASSTDDFGSVRSGIGPVSTKHYSGSGRGGGAPVHSRDDFGSVRSWVGPVSTMDYSGSGRGGRGPLSTNDGSGRDGRAPSSSSTDDFGSVRSWIGPVSTKDYSGSGRGGRGPVSSIDDFGSVRSGIGPVSTRDYSGSGRGGGAPVHSRDDLGSGRSWIGPVSTKDYSGSARDGRAPASSRDDLGYGRSCIDPVSTKDYSGSGRDGGAQASSRDDLGSGRSRIGPVSTKDYSGSSRDGSGSDGRGQASTRDGPGRDGSGLVSTIDGSGRGRGGPASTRDDSGSGRGQANTSRDQKSPPETEPLSGNITEAKCASCNYVGTSLDQLKTHEQEAHKNQPVDTKSMSEAETTKKVDPPCVPGMVPEHIRKSIQVLSDYVGRADREPLIGLECVLEYKVLLQTGVQQVKYYCKICETDSTIITMVDHLCGFRHRKLYVTKNYPYILPALFKTKDGDRTVFMRRMAMEIEREEGLKEYIKDPIVRTVALMNVKSTEAKQSKRGTRWNSESEKQKKMNDALKCLDSLTIANEEEAASVEKLLLKVQTDIKTHTDKLKEEALFSARVTRAKGAAISIMRNAVRERVARLPSLMKIPYDKVIEVSEHFDVSNDKGNPGGPLRPNKPNRVPNASFPPRPQSHPSFPINQRQEIPMAAEKNTWQDQLANLDEQIDENDEDFVFLKKLTAMLDLLPQTPTVTNDSEMDSKLQVLKSFLLDDSANIENMPTDQLLLQLASLTEGMTGMEDLSLNPLSSTMAPQNTPALGNFGQVLPTQITPAPVDSAQANQDALMKIAALLQDSQGNANTFLPENRNVPNLEYRQRDDRLMMPQDQVANRMVGYASTSQSSEEFGYDRPMMRRFEEATTSQYDDRVKSRDYYRSSDPTRDRYAEGRYDSGMYGRHWNEPPYSNPSNRGARQDYDDYAADQSYNRGSQRLEQDVRRESRAFEDRSGYGARDSRTVDHSPWAQRGYEPYYGKRTKLDSDPMTSRDSDQRRYYGDETGSIGVKAPRLSADILKMIRGKDLFTVSEILSEYADGHSA